MARMYQDQGKHDRMNSAARAPRDATRSLARLNLASLVVVGLIGVACSSNDNGSGPSGIGGATGTGTGGATSNTGGKSNATGGASNPSVGGQGTTTGGAASTGGNSATGGAATGGKSSTGATGGAATGGKSSTSATGGAATGGKSSTGAIGGAATGGKSSTGVTGGNSSTPETGGTANTGGDTSPGGAAATGGSTAGGATGCAPATITKVSDADYELQVCDVKMHVNPKIGARVTSLTLGSAAIIQQHTATTYSGSDASNNAGITFWTSPQSSWNPTWPPVAAVDGNAYTVTDAGATSGHLVLTGAADTTLGASVVKDISADPATGWITIKYTIKATKAIQVAPWQIARVPRAGIVFFPCSTSPIKSPSVAWTLSQASGYDWIDDKSQTTVTAQSDGSKYVVNGAAVSGQTYTLLAYALGGNLLLFKYPDASTFATGEGDTEVYPGTGYMELESQGDYKSLSTNGTLSWSIQMRVDPIDTSAVTVASGSATLISYAEQQAAL